VRKRHLTLLASFGLLVLPSCSRQSTITPEDLRSELNAAISTASEAEAFIETVQQHRTTPQFANAHLGYLADQSQNASQELQASSAKGPLARPLQDTQSQVTLLNNELIAVRNHCNDSDALAASKDRIRSIRQTLEQTKHSL
jgi:hypothetical protein